MGVRVGPGATIAGRYRLESPIGAGGFGAVFRATDLRTGGPVAVKVLTEGAVESGARFRREAELAMRLSHPNTVRTLDAGEDAVPYMVLELLEGGSLEQVLRANGALGPRRAAEIGLAVLDSLREAHAIGIVHRDIKPANVFLQRVPAGGVKVLDFGIAKSTNEGTRAGLTKEGQTIGTPAYMAPEQVKGAELGPETDLYALGLVLAEVVSGTSVYANDNGLAVLVAKLHGNDPPFAGAVLGTSLEAVVRRATRPEREDRFRSADEMRRAIEQAMGEIPASSSSQRGGDRGSMPGSGQPGVEWGTESMPHAAPSSATDVGHAETFGMHVPTVSAAVPTARPSYDDTSSASGLSSAPTAAQASMPVRLSSASQLPASAPLGSAPPGPPPARTEPPPPAFDARSSGSALPYAPSPLAPTLPPGARAPTKQSSGLAVGCSIAAVLAFLALAGVVGVVAYLAYHLTGGGEPDKPRSTKTARKTSAPVAPSPPPAPPAPRTAAVQISCPALPTLETAHINAKVNAAPGYRVQDQTTSLGAGSSVELTMKRNGEDAGRLVFIDGASPAAVATQEAARRSDEPDAVYATSGGKLLYIALSYPRAQDLLPSLCGQGAAPL